MPSANFVRRGTLPLMARSSTGQHNSMNVKLLLTTVMAMACVTTVSLGAVEERGNLVLDDIPAVDTPLTTRLEDYMNSRGASFVDWLPGGGLLISTRFADVEQLHRVAAPMGDREQLTFFREPITVARTPHAPRAPGCALLPRPGGWRRAAPHPHTPNSA